MKRYKVRMLPVARLDIQDASAWYKQHNNELPVRFKEQIRVSVEKIRQAPFVYAVRYKQIRIANLHVFPYGIHYILQDNFVLIIGVHHSAINPQKWIRK